MADTDELGIILPPLPPSIGGETQFGPMAGNVLGFFPGSLAAPQYDLPQGAVPEQMYGLTGGSFGGSQGDVSATTAAAPPPPSVAERTRAAQEKLLGLLGGLPNAAAADLAASRAAAASQAAARGQLAERYKVAAEAPLPDLYKPQYRPVPEAPKPVYREPFQALGAPLAALALVAGAFTRNSGTAVLTAASTAMEAQAKGDQVGYENARSEFKDALDTTMKNNEMERNAYRDAWSDRKATFDERVSNLALWSSYYQNKAMSSAASGGNVAQINAQIAGLTSTLGVLKQMEPAYKSVSEAKGAVLTKYFAMYPDDIPRAISEAAPLIKEITDAETKLGSGGPTAASEKSVTMQALEQKHIAAGVDPADARIKAEEDYRRLEAIGKGRLTAEELAKRDRLKIEAAVTAADKREAAAIALFREQAKARVEAAKANDAKIKGPEQKTIEGLASINEELTLLRNSWRDEFAGLTGVKTADEFVLRLGEKYGQDVVDAGALWWRMKNRVVDMPVRHAAFGATLTGNELTAFNNANFDVSMNSAQIKAMMDNLLDAEQRHIANWARILSTRGVTPETLSTVFKLPIDQLGLGAAPQRPPPPPAIPWDSLK